jgi:hypothetical protein
VGQSVRCLAAFEGQTAEGTAQLETDELRFRGAFRLTIPFRDVRHAEAQDGRLTVTFGGGTAVFDLGARAPKWADKILHPPTLLDKLGIKAGQRVRLVGITDKDFIRDLAEHEVIRVRSVRGAAVGGDGATGGPPDLLLYGAETMGDLDEVGRLREALPTAGALWIIYPKGRRDLREVDVLGAGRAAGLTDVKVVRFSGTHTALKFVVPRARR